MSNVWFCSDLHLGHKRIAEFRGNFISSVEENTTRILGDWNKFVTKRDIVFVLGDFCFDKDLFDTLNLPGQTKYLVRGNHDRFQTVSYLKFFSEIEGIIKYKGMWLSHPPIHPSELRGKVNIHGHTHFSCVPEKEYLNVCPEQLWPKYGRCLISLDEIRKHFIS